MLAISHVNFLANTPALKLAVAGWHELLQRDLCGESGCLVAWDQHAIIANIDDKPIGVMTWFDNDWSNAVHVMIAYVLPEYRRQGVHRAMWKALVAKAQELNRPVIQSSVHISNMESRAAMIAEQRFTTGFNTSFRVPPRI